MSLRTLLLILAAGTGARIAALGLNRILDRGVDRENPRTVSRELPSGAMSLAEAWAVTGSGVALFLGSAYGISLRCLVLAPIPLAIFLLYPFLKRFTMWAHLGVGAALAMGPLGAWYAVQLDFRDFGNALLLCLFTFFWVAGFDVIYATLDQDFDRSRGLHSLPSRIGRDRALRVSRAFHAAAFFLLLLLYWKALEGPLAAVLLGLIGALLVVEHRRASDVDLAFFKINAALGFAVLAFVAVGLNPPFSS
jgi:4-hydroxybenzoate polyprenyltransferase